LGHRYRSGPQQRGNERRQRLIDAAEEMLAERPLNEVSYKEIAARAEEHSIVESIRKLFDRYFVLPKLLARRKGE